MRRASWQGVSKAGFSGWPASAEIFGDISPLVAYKPFMRSTTPDALATGRNILEVPRAVGLWWQGFGGVRASAQQRF